MEDLCVVGLEGLFGVFVLFGGMGDLLLAFREVIEVWIGC